MFRSHKDLVLENLALRQQLLTFHVKRPRRRLSAPQKLFWVALTRLWAGMAEAAGSGNPKNGDGVAPCRLPSVLEMAIQSQAPGRSQALRQEDSGADLSHGGGESDLGSTSYPRLIAKTWLQRFGTDGLTLAAASPTQPRRGQALADVSAQPSRSHRRHGLLYGADDHLRRPVLLLRHCSRPTEDSALPDHPTPECSMDRAADARILTHAQCFRIRRDCYALSHTLQDCVIESGGGLLPTQQQHGPQSWE
jgi:hypothetical protein